jgi:uncharacterized protein
MVTFLTVLMNLPFAFVLWLANMAERQKARQESAQTLTIITYLLVASLYALLLGVGLLLQVVGLLAGSGLLGLTGATMPASGLDAYALAPMGLGMWVPALAALLLLLPPVRRLASRVLPLQPDNLIHAVALSFAMVAIMNLTVTMAMGLGNLASSLESSGQTLGNTAVLLWTQEGIWAFTALVGVGWLSRRSFGGALTRLGVVLPRLGHVAVGLGIGVGLAVLVTLALGLLKVVGIGMNQDVERLGERLLGPLTQTWYGILTMGLSAALGEETIFRGALLPRFGLLFTALLFALLHSNYGLSLATVVVFCVGLALGAVRLRMNTTIAMVVHATYNITLGLAAYFSFMQLQ